LNSNKRADIFAYANRIATFFLPEYKDAKQVILSGSFNNWSTMQMPMEKTDSGWVFSLPLAPGKHLYKYIVDGRWMHDQLNDLHEDDGNNGFNSIVYCYNFCFHLNGFTNAKKVYITGSFINWQRKQLRMIRSVGGWQLPIYLREGTHAYKFIVDNEWINDPDNTIVRPDGHGNFNSFLGIGDSVVFRLQGYNNAREVKLAGDFNAWNPEELLMMKTVDGWELPYALGAGNFEYKFIVDGTWMPDPDNPHRRGKGMYENSVLTNKPNFMFELDGYPEAKQVIVTGSFNGWQTDNFVMERKESKWTYSLFLKPGKHLYKFIVDGVWILDPANDLWEDNAEGTGNSILWIE
jgi:1,4-alpha-glucan branching enzyme